MIWFPLSCRGFELIRVDMRGLRVASTSQKWQGGRFHLEHGCDPGAQRTSRHVRTSENHDAPIRPVCQMLNKYVSWLLKYVVWLSQLENYRLCVGKLRGHFLFMFFSLLSHFTYSAKHFLVANWIDCTLIRRLQDGRSGQLQKQLHLLFQIKLHTIKQTKLDTGFGETSLWDFLF